MKRPCQCQKPPVTPAVLPEFARGNTVATTSYAKTTYIAMLPGTKILLKGFSPKRIAIGFVAAGAVAGAAYFNPFSNTTTTMGWTFTGNYPLWFDLTTYGPLVSNEWWGISGMGISLQIIECLLN